MYRHIEPCIDIFDSNTQTSVIPNKNSTTIQYFKMVEDKRTTYNNVFAEIRCNDYFTLLKTIICYKNRALMIMCKNKH